MQQLAFYFGLNFKDVQSIDLSPKKKKPIQVPKSPNLEEKVEDVLSGLTLRQQFERHSKIWDAFNFANQHVDRFDFGFWPGFEQARCILMDLYPNMARYIDNERRFSNAQVKRVYLTIETFKDHHKY